MKTLKIREETHNKLTYIKASLKIDQHINLKTLDNVIEYLYECFLEIGKKEEDLVNEKTREIFGK